MTKPVSLSGTLHVKVSGCLMLYAENPLDADKTDTVVVDLDDARLLRDHLNSVDLGDGEPVDRTHRRLRAAEGRPEQ